MAGGKIVDRTEQLAIDKRNRMAEIEAQYLRAKEYLKSETFTVDQVNALEKIRKVLRQGLMQEAEGLQMIGRIQQILLDAFDHENVIMEYEELKQRLTEKYGEK